MEKITLDNQQSFLEPEWALGQKPMRPKVEWALDSEAMKNNCFSKIQVVAQKISKQNILR